MKARRLIRGKFDSLYKFVWDRRANRVSKQKVQGHFMTPMDYARRNKGGMGLLEHARRQPWETWKGRYLYI